MFFVFGTLETKFPQWGFDLKVDILLINLVMSLLSISNSDLHSTMTRLFSLVGYSLLFGYGCGQMVG